MADNHLRIRDELLASRFTLEQSPEGRCGVYAFFIQDLDALAQLVVPRLPDFGDGLLYVGMTSPGEGNTARDHVECDHSGGSTLRRSLGALLKDRLQPRLSAMRRAPADSPQNWRCYRFQDEGEAALTRWMKANLRTNFVSLDGEWETVRACERKLIEGLRPPLNLTDWDNPQRRMIKGLRAQCAREARLGPTIGTSHMSQKIEMTLQVGNQVQANELQAAWQEIVSGQKITHAGALEHGIEGIMESARSAIQVIETAIRENPTTGQAERLVRFLAALYNGYDYAFDLIDLRALDTRLANACLDYLNYDRLGKQEVHHHLSGGERELQRWIERYGIEPRKPQG